VARSHSNLVLSYLAEHVLGLPDPTDLPLSGRLVVSLEQAVAAPCLPPARDAGARVIRWSGRRNDFAPQLPRWCGRRLLRLAQPRQGRGRSPKPADKALMEAMIAKADVFVQNLKPGAVGKLGFNWY
jgi:formyl-CoA transferase